MRLDWLEYFVFHEYSTTLLACVLRLRMLTAPMTVARTVVAAPKSLRTPAPGAATTSLIVTDVGATPPAAASDAMRVVRTPSVSASKSAALQLKAWPH